MIWIRDERGRLSVDDAAIRARVKRGFRLVVFVTVILLSEPVVLFVAARRAGATGRGAELLAHSLAAVVLLVFLWTGLPVLRWIGAAALFVMGVLAVWEFAVARPGTGSALQAIHGAFGIAAAGLLDMSRSVKLYLAHREVRM
jgi:hypothetical protein